MSLIDNAYLEVLPGNEVCQFRTSVKGAFYLVITRRHVEQSNHGIEDIYGLVFEAFQGGQAKIQLQAFPFRMTMTNLVRHEQDPNVSFWQMLKTGGDAFLETGQPPTVAVCDQRYVFNPLAMNRDLDPSGPCPSDITVTTDVATQAASASTQQLKHTEIQLRGRDHPHLAK
jgi:murein L,D-transpeptidase YafK